MGKALGVGLMSGTSLDGIDAVLVEIEEKEDNVDVNIIDLYTQHYDQDVRKALMDVCSPSTATVQKINSINMFLGKEFGGVVNKLLKQANVSKNDVHFISSHGQTIYHQPFDGESNLDVAGTLQIGDISVLSEETGIAVVGDFRTADMAASGQGAPLVSYVDYLLFNNPNKSRAIQNIGGIGNVTYVPENSNSDGIQSFDTGPGNMVIDEVVYRLTNGKRNYDKDGEMAYRGTINQQLLTKLMSHDYFKKEPPKTTGRELFGNQFVDEIFKEYGQMNPEDLVATVSEWTVLTIAHSYNQFLMDKGHKIDEVIVGGGGSYNPYLIERLNYHLPEVIIFTHEHFDMSSDLKEAMAFAVLGFQCILGKYNQLPSATGAKRQVIMGKIAYTQPDALERIDTLRRGS
ncbi:anhydro-N-acetylmuramic acid kinase [Virgibacillus subterraneus]|uniref:Anhydro-N-acetylmuramic acid kinase n=1 Tax=Virgibacillus subterraneus TaxID=621109 RepID=A0A1H9BI58_9BACI|nr:anhydro-N-acetylmuramic acid kinase [Virgibacillus subterraneus]SEP88585.1 anhydro-N-acetylmuramic acid kinase [Virgibacillus subterraneus]